MSEGKRGEGGRDLERVNITRPLLGGSAKLIGLGAVWGGLA